MPAPIALLADQEEAALAAAADGMSEEAAYAAAIEVVGADGQVKTDFLVLPFGDPIQARDGRSWIMRDRGHAERVLAATRETLGSTDMMIDYDHQAAHASDGKGNRAPAAGWVKNLRIEDDGIHVTVDWTEGAQAALASREYRYISPDFRFAKASREVTRLVRAGLTNSPALDLPALAHRKDVSPGEDLKMKTITISCAALCTALALAIKPDDLDEAALLSAIGDLKTGKDGSEAALASVRKQLQLAEDADEGVVLAAIQTAANAGEPDPTKYVPKQGYDELAGRLKTLEEDKVLASVDDAVAAGKIPPSMKAWAIDLGKKDEAALASYIAQATPFAAGKTVDGKIEPDKGKLSEEEKAICAMTGLSEADYLKTRDEEAA